MRLKKINLPCFAELSLVPVHRIRGDVEQKCFPVQCQFRPFLNGVDPGYFDDLACQIGYHPDPFGKTQNFFPVDFTIYTIFPGGHFKVAVTPLLGIFILFLIVEARPEERFPCQIDPVHA